MKILKFGGTSVGSPKVIKQVSEIIKKAQKDWGKVAVVVSAFSGITDQLIRVSQMAASGDENYEKELNIIKKRHQQAAKELIPRKNYNKALKTLNTLLSELEDILEGIYLIKEATKRTLDLAMSFGERLSAYIISQTLNAEFLDSRQLVKTDDNFGYARIQFEKTYKNIREYFKKHPKLQLITGFIGSTDNNETTTIGRGGSDYSASIFGAALNADEIQIWTDVDGIMTADPRKVRKTFSIPNLTYQEAMEMSHFGAKVIHPPTMQPALAKNIPICIKNTLNLGFPGSIISNKSDKNGLPVKGISSIGNISLLRVQGSGLIGVAGISNRLFGALSREKISVILISQASSEHSICFAIPTDGAEKAKKAIEQEFELEIHNQQMDKVIIEKEMVIVAVVGENMRNTPGTSGKLFQALGKNGINVVAIAQGSSELNISAVIPQKDEAKAIATLHDAFFLSDTKSLNIFLIGTGLIGSTLLKQISQQHDRIKKDQGLDIKIIALANSRKMFFNEDGISLPNWQEVLENSTQRSNIEEFVEKMKELNLPNSIFVDCSTSEDIAAQYENILKASISIATPNKKANSSNSENYLKLALAASKSNAKFLYETNVGAGLPILSTLKDLQYSGDEIIKIEAVLSGTLSYIFNSFTGEKPFSAVVKEAQEKGYTEPDPRDDLNGLDVARKLLILARETGKLLDLKDVKVENLVPENCRKATSIEDFFVELKKADNYFAEKQKQAAKKGEKLCYIASLQGETAKVSLQSIDNKHPFYSLSGSDNIISFTTTRYKNNPLVVKGPGAGAEVTAGGVFADILRISNTSFDTKLARYSFLEKLRKKKLVVSLIGMSNIGKTFWSNRLKKLGFKHICCDDLIEEKLAPILRKRGYRGLADVAKWMGQPYEKRFKKTQEQYLDCEKQAIQEIIKEIKSSNKNIIIDTTGSVIYTEEKTLSEFKKHSLIVYLEATPEMKEEMYKNYIKNPKPVVWGSSYQQRKNEKKEEALAKCYPELLNYRSKLYSKLADVTIPYQKLKENGMDEEKFLSLIQEKL